MTEWWRQRSRGRYVTAAEDVPEEDVGLLGRRTIKDLLALGPLLVVGQADHGTALEDALGDRRLEKQGLGGRHERGFLFLILQHFVAKGGRGGPLAAAAVQPPVHAFVC